ncbi:MAG TPA: 6,7-dimethyl-8-ribityllumazine synthase, partial [Thermodesulfobacteriota bacterium]|nr:6,7-dimethyl-8-ribityllumazine synthase [Thermodesulfobacteriota bacterium]
MRTIEGGASAQGLRVAVIASRFNEFVTERLLAGALDTLTRNGAAADAIDVIRVPGAFEIPLAAQEAARSGRYDAVVCVGCVIRGATAHFEYVAGEMAAGIAAVARETGVPVGFGVLTTETTEQAIERAGGKGGNKGSEAALAAVEMANLLRELRRGGAVERPAPLPRVARPA